MSSEFLQTLQVLSSAQQPSFVGMGGHLVRIESDTAEDFDTNAWNLFKNDGMEKFFKGFSGHDEKLSIEFAWA